MYTRYSKSIPQKAFIIGLETLLLVASYLILFQGGFEWLAAIFHWNIVPGNLTRRSVLFIFNCIVYVRMLVTMFYLLKREIPWEEAFSIPLAFALYYVGYALLGYQTQAALDWLDWFGIGLFSLFAFYNIPALDKHLAEHYGQQFSEYSHKTKKFIPFLY